MSLYSKRGVSAQKEDVHAVIKNLDKGLYKNAFCKIYPDYISGDDEFVNIMPAPKAFLLIYIGKKQATQVFGEVLHKMQ